MCKIKLVIAPHIDDCVLGCGGIIDQKTKILYCGVEDFHVVSRKERIDEATEVGKYFGSSFVLMDGFTVNEYRFLPIMRTLQDYINSIEPEEIYIPYPSYNQDHRVVHDACWTALRPHDKNFFVKKVLVYEQPHVFLWSRKCKFEPNYFVPIDIKKKLHAWGLMKSQNRSYRSPEMLVSMAELRGKQGNCEYAEAFQISRWVI